MSMQKIIAAFALFLCLAFAQRPAAEPRFEVASVKRVAAQGGPGDIPRNMDSSPGHFAMRNVPLRYCLEWAYDLKDYQISGPEWIKGEERYDILATAPGASEEQMKPMLQALLTERFQMKLHRESRTMSVYALVPGKGPAKVKPPTPGTPGLSGGQSGVTFQNQPLSRLTFMLSRRMDRPVLDMTGLPGVYDFTLDVSGLNTFNPGAIDDLSNPSIFTAVETDLGLKLDSRKAPVEVLAIDSVNKIPIDN
jgi:uncharacterized protein (TIGR03435 family)